MELLSLPDSIYQDNAHGSTAGPSQQAGVRQEALRKHPRLALRQRQCEGRGLQSNWGAPRPGVSASGGAGVSSPDICPGDVDLRVFAGVML